MRPQGCDRHPLSDFNQQTGSLAGYAALIYSSSGCLNVVCQDPEPHAHCPAGQGPSLLGANLCSAMVD